MDCLWLIENFNDFSDEFFDELGDAKCPDVSLDDVELIDDGEDWQAKFQKLEPPPLNVLCFENTKANKISAASEKKSSLPSRTFSPVSVLDANTRVSSNSTSHEKLVIPARRPRSKRNVHRRRSFSNLGFSSKISKVEETRQCTHCQVSKTPQWREGPMGPKSLCNACGVRYRSGRLFPEYRPVASPTFIPSLHSNSHRKVLEMRKKTGEVAVVSVR